MTTGSDPRSNVPTTGRVNTCAGGRNSSSSATIACGSGCGYGGTGISDGGRDGVTDGGREWRLTDVCLEWFTDGCRDCVREAGGEGVCIGTGIGSGGNGAVPSAGSDSCTASVARVASTQLEVPDDIVTPGGDVVTIVDGDSTSGFAWFCDQRE